MATCISFSLEIILDGLASRMTIRIIYYMVWDFTAILMGYLSKKADIKVLLVF